MMSQDALMTWKLLHQLPGFKVKAKWALLICVKSKNYNLYKLLMNNWAEFESVQKSISWIGKNLFYEIREEIIDAAFYCQHLIFTSVNADI
jgi:hypothetical protein